LLRFAHIVDAGSFSKAAGSLRVSQPALSMAVAQLERELKADLLVRGSRPLQMTEAGRRAYLAAQDIAVATSDLQSRLGELRGGKQLVTFGMNDSIAQGLLSDQSMLQTIESQAHVSLVVNNSRFLHQAVASGEVDVAFSVGAASMGDKALAVQPVGDERLVLVCQPNYVAQAERALQTGRLPHFISYDQQSASRQIVQQALQLNNITATVNFFSTSPEVMLRLVMLRQGVAALPYLQVASMLASGELVHLAKDVEISRPIVRLMRRRKAVSPVMDELTLLVSRLLQAPRS